MSQEYYGKQKERDNMNDLIKIERAMNTMTELAHGNAVAHGFYDEHKATVGFLVERGMHQMARSVGRNFILAQLAKTSGEAGEAVDAIQRDKSDEAFAEEIADIVIRAADLCGFLGLDLGAAVSAKMQKNIDRPYLHGKTC